jgi:hypothetical protein
MSEWFGGEAATGHRSDFERHAAAGDAGEEAVVGGGRPLPMRMEGCVR